MNYPLKNFKYTAAIHAQGRKSDKAFHGYVGHAGRGGQRIPFELTLKRGGGRALQEVFNGKKSKMCDSDGRSNFSTTNVPTPHSSPRPGPGRTHTPPAAATLTIISIL